MNRFYMELELDVKHNERPTTFSVEVNPPTPEIGGSDARLSATLRDERQSLRTSLGPLHQMPKSVCHSLSLFLDGQTCRSTSPMRGDVKKKISPLLSERRRMVAFIQPDLRSGEALCSRRASDRPRRSGVSARRFHDSMVRRLRCEATQANRGGSNTPTMVLFEARGL